MDTNNITPQKQNGSWSLGIKILASIGSVTLALAIFLPPFNLTFANSYWEQAMVQTQGIPNAIELFETQYSVLPLLPNYDPKESIPTDEAMTNILIGTDTGSNPRSTVFLESRIAVAASKGRPARAGFVEHGNNSTSLVDPWGNHYMIRIDYDDDGFIDAPDGGDPIQAKVICWSYGKPEDNRDYRSALKNSPPKWIKSW